MRSDARKTQTWQTTRHKEEDQKISADYSTLSYSPPSFKGQLALPPEWILPLFQALQEYIRENYV